MKWYFLNVCADRHTKHMIPFCVSFFGSEKKILEKRKIKQTQLNKHIQIIPYNQANPHILSAKQ